MVSNYSAARAYKQRTGIPRNCANEECGIVFMAFTGNVRLCPDCRGAHHQAKVNQWKRDHRKPEKQRVERPIGEIRARNRDAKSREGAHYERIKPSVIPAYNSHDLMRMSPERMQKVLEMVKQGKAVIAR